MSIKEFVDSHKVGFCKKPNNLMRLMPFSASQSFMAPTEIVLRGRCTRTEDQGSSPMCAAYSAAQWAENIRWMLTGSPYPDVNPLEVYKYAKKVDGMPDSDGTTITAALEALIKSDVALFDGNKCKVKVVRPNRLSLKYAVHKFGCCLAGFNITEDWYKASYKDPVIKQNENASYFGGHCVLVCGYDKRYVYVQNSWGEAWGEYGFAMIEWGAFDRQFMYGGVITSVLDGMTLN